MRKLLLHKAQIVKLFSKIREQGYTLIPLRIYFKEGKVKAELGLAKGKNNYDKREVMKQKDMQRDLVAGLKERSRGSRDRE